MKRTRLKSKEVTRELADFSIILSKKDQVEKCDTGDVEFIAVNKVPSFFYHDGKLLPTLKYLLEHDVLKRVTVDMGAVRFVVNGADIMRPGVVGVAEGVVEGEYVVIVDENNMKPLAVGQALLSSSEMQNQSSGKSVKNVHYVGDSLWNAEL